MSPGVALPGSIEGHRVTISRAVLLSMPGQPVHDLSAGFASKVGAVKDALTALAILLGGTFTYFKFVKAPTLGPRVKLNVHIVGEQSESRPADVHARNTEPTALRVDVTIKNEGQIALRLPAEADHTLSVLSVTRNGLSRATTATNNADGARLPAPAARFTDRDSYFAATNILHDDGVPPPNDVRLEPGEEACMSIVFGVPRGLDLAAFLVVLKRQDQVQKLAQNRMRSLGDAQRGAGRIRGRSTKGRTVTAGRRLPGPYTPSPQSYWRCDVPDCAETAVTEDDSREPVCRVHHRAMRPASEDGRRRGR